MDDQENQIEKSRRTQIFNETHFRVLSLKQEKMADLIMELANVNRETAEKALAEHGQVWLAVDALLVKPISAADKHIPPPPKVDSGLSEEQKQMCERGRWLQDKVNAVFSVAHSQIRTQPDQLALVNEEHPVESNSTTVAEKQKTE